MKNVMIGKIKAINFDEGMRKPDAIIKTSEGRTYKMPLMSKGVWQFLRLEYGRSVDNEIKQYKLDSNEQYPLYHFAMQKVRDEKPEGEWQILIKDNRIITVASKQHVLYTEEQIYTLVKKRLKKLDLVSREPLFGRVIYVNEVPGLRLGVQVYAGDIFTTHAIKFATFIEVKQCFNPLTFLSLRSMIVGREITQMTKILRIRKKEDMKDRLTEALRNSLESVKDSVSIIEKSKITKITNDQATKLLVAMNSSYYLGTKVTKSCLTHYETEKRSHKPTLWALAMATSWVAQHGECFDTHHEKTRGNLSSISGALLMIEDVEKSIKGCEEFIKKNGHASSIYAEILKSGKK